jgi:NAD(P)-dependent dehydrogenase (short-subunit alcohol dehydrogenase family)
METKTPQKQDRQPGIEAEMNPSPEYIKETYKAAGKLTEKIALITGGDSGIGRAVSIHFAKEGADIAIVYLDEDEDADFTKAQIEAAGRKCLLLKGDIKEPSFCKDAVKRTVQEYGKLNILVNNAGMQFPQKDVKEIDPEQLNTTFKTNIFA